MIIDCHGHYTTVPAAHTRLPRRAAGRAGRPGPPATGRPRDRRRRDPRERREQPAEGPARARRATSCSSRRRPRRWSTTCPTRRSPSTGRAPATTSIHRVDGLFPDHFAGVCQLPQTPERQPGRRVAELRRCVERARLRRLQPQPRPVRRALDRAAADRPVLVPAVRGDGRARRAGDGARVGVVQPELPHARRALPQRRHDGVHAAGRGRPVRAVPDAAVGHPARRRRGAVPLGPLPRAGRPDAAGRRATHCCATSSSTPASTTSPGSTCCSG